MGEGNFVVVHLQAGKGEATSPFNTQPDSRKFVMEENRTSSLFINVTLRRVRATIVAVEKAISITYSECVFVALCI